MEPPTGAAAARDPFDLAAVFGKALPAQAVLADAARGTLELLPAPPVGRNSWGAAALTGLVLIGVVLAAAGRVVPAGAALLAAAVGVALRGAARRRPSARLIFGNSGLIVRRPRARYFVPWSIIDGVEPGGAPLELRLRVTSPPFGPFPVAEHFAPPLLRFLTRGQYRLRHEIADRRLTLALGPGHDLEAVHAAVRWFVGRRGAASAVAAGPGADPGAPQHARPSAAP